MPSRFDAANPIAPHDRDVHDCCGPDGLRLSTRIDEVAGSSPARSFIVLR